MRSNPEFAEVLAPVVLFCYNRPSSTLRTLTALSENTLASVSKLFVFCDGPKTGASEEQREKVREVRECVKSKAWCGEITIVESESNKGLATSVIEGVTRVVNEFGKVIVLEDDLVTSKYFLEYMNTALDKYEHVEKVMQISGYQFPISQYPANVAGFLPMATSWGWATWAHAWNKFDADCKGFQALREDKSLRRRFDLDHAYPYSDMLLNQMSKVGNIDSWAIRWWWTIFKSNGLSLFPGASLVQNIGFGADATHTTATQQLNKNWSQNSSIVDYPDKTEVDEVLWYKVRSCIGEMLTKKDKGPAKNWWKRIFRIQD